MFFSIDLCRSQRTCQRLAFSTVAARGQRTAPLACTEHRKREKAACSTSPPPPPQDHLDAQAHCVLSVASTLFGKETEGERLLASLSTPGVLWSKSIKHTKDPITTGSAYALELSIVLAVPVNAGGFPGCSCTMARGRMSASGTKQYIKKRLLFWAPRRSCTLMWGCPCHKRRRGL